MPTALFINGVYESVLREILDAQVTNPDIESFLQPYSGDVIQLLSEEPPSAASPTRLYTSTTDRLSNICYTAEITGWEDKRQMSEPRRAEVLEHLQRFQAKECDLFFGRELGDGKAVNLITIRRLRALETLPPTSFLVKTSDGTPLKKRTRAGGYSYVIDRGDLESFSVAATETEESLAARLSNDVAQASAADNDTIARRMASAPRLPERVQVVSIGFRRNPDVIVAVLRRAKGVCEKCHNPAPFLRRSDGSPFLEVHHVVSLADGGEDTVANALALCPNCHRQAHHG